LADTLGFSEEQLLQSSVLVDNDQIEKFYNDKLSELQNEEFDAKKYTGQYKAEL
jgi:hypothetical protein